MFLNDLFVTKLICFLCFMQMFLLNMPVCGGCNNNCDVQRVPDSSSVPAFLGEAFATKEDIWIKLKDTFKKLVIQLKIDTQFDFKDDKISDQNLTLTKENVLEAISSANLSHWNKIKVEVIKKDVSWAPDPYNIVATIGKHTFVKETGLWWRINTIKSMQFLGQGGFNVSLGCEPCEHKSKGKEPQIEPSPVHDSLVGKEMEYVIESTGLCGTEPPWFYILTGIIVLLILMVILLIVTFKYLFTRKNAPYKKKSVGLPYLEGNYFKEENIYDDLSSPKKGKLKEENIYDEINVGSSSKPDPADGFESLKTAASDASEPTHSSPSKSDEPLYQAISLPLADTPEGAGDLSSLNSTDSSLESHHASSVEDEQSSERVPEKDDHLQDGKMKSEDTLNSPRHF